MTDEQFNTLLATFGADLSRWPHDSRVAAMALLRDSAGAQRAYEAARALDMDLRREDERLAPDRRAALVDSIMGALDDGEDSSGEAGDAAGRAPLPPGGSRAAPVPPARPVRPALPVGILGLALPRRAHLIAYLGIGLLVGVAVAQAIQATQVPYPILPVRGVVEQWMR